MSKTKLPAQREQFCLEYITDFNATRAAERAKYSAKTAKQTGSRLLTYVDVQNRIQELIDKRNGKLEITQQKILNELAILGFSDFNDYFEVLDGGEARIKKLSELPHGASKAIRAVEEDRVIKENADGTQVIVYDKIKYKLHDKIKPLIALGTHLGLNLNRVSINGKFQGTFKLEGSMKDFEDCYDKFASADKPDKG